MRASLRIASKLCAIALLTAGLINIADVAHAQDSVTVPGQVAADQCPTGFQYATGIEVRIGVGEFTVCYAAPNASDLLKQQQDADFQARVSLAQAAAQVESQAWNSANPGFQKCVQWGPVVHANGVTTESGAVCANPITPSSPPVALPTDPIVDQTVLPEPPLLAVTGQPFTVEIAGNHGVGDCPVGYQGANGISVNVTTGVVTTVCWSPAAWQAYRIGGDTWTNFVASGGSYNPQASIDRQQAIDGLKSMAQQRAQAAADATPGVQRCTSWTGYGTSGEECAYTFVAPTPAPTQSQSATQVSSQPTAAPAEASPSVATSSVKLNYSSKTKSVCIVVATKVIRKKAGTCVLSVTRVDSNGVTSTTLKKIVFTK